MKKVLIITPYFPPINAADMQRIRMSLPYFENFNWLAEVITVNPEYSELSKDELLMQNIPTNIKIHYVKAFSQKWTKRFGLGSIALRSIWFYKNYVDEFLKENHFDLIYFSTTQFPLLILGKHWKKKFKIPYVIDMQDPWHSTYYENKPKNEQPAKYWFSYRLNKYLEPLAMKNVGGLISVSQAYLDTLIDRYPQLADVPTRVITFGAFKKDFELVKKQMAHFKSAYDKQNDSINLVYVGRGGHDLKEALLLLFTAFKKGLTEQPSIFNKIKFHFIGTSYAPKGEGIPTIMPIADEMDVADYVNEQTDRISFYESIYNLITADALLILGSDDPQYTASKIYPYILAEKPLMAYLHPKSSSAKIIKDTNAGNVISIKDEVAIPKSYDYLMNLANHLLAKPLVDWQAFEPFSAKNMTKNQCILFDKVII